MVSIYQEPELFLIRLEVIGEFETYGVMTKNCEIVVIGDLADCLAYMRSAGEDTTKYDHVLKEELNWH
jgi:hypothetical protein